MVHILLYAIVPIIVVMLAGYISGKKGIFSAKDGKAFNKVVLDYALPAALFVSIVDADRDMLVKDLKLSIISLVVIMVCFMIVYFIYAKCFKGLNGADGAIMALVNGSPTIGFLGFAVLEPIFGTTPYVALVVAIVGIVVNAVGIPVGLSLLNNSLSKTAAANSTTTQHNSVWKSVLHALAQPVAWAPILAVIWVVAGIPWPKYLSPSFDLIKGANASMAVFAAGITLSAFKININWQAILGMLLKMVMMPAMLLIVGLIFHMDKLNLEMLVVAGALPPAFSGIIIADEYDTYVSTSTSSLALSVVLFIVFCPLWIWITESCYSMF
ncbi:MAG: AEC family transporter [Muribaculaceae bacterium]|nr:AEC family transporter [Muribaculaceae bacterium]